MARTRRIFGPLTYSTLAFAAVALLIKGAYEYSPAVREAWEVRSLARQLRDPNAVVRQTSAERLGDIGPRALPFLIDAMDDPRWEVRLLACSQLLHADRGPGPAIPALIDALDDEHPSIRAEAAEDLGLVSSRYGPSLPAERRTEASRALRPLLKDPDRDVRLKAAEAVWRIEPGTRDEALAVMIGVAVDPKPYRNRWGIIEEIRKHEPGAVVEAVPALVRFLRQHDDPGLRNEGLECLAWIGERRPGHPRVVEAVPVLKELLRDRDREVRYRAATALVTIDRSQAAPAIPVLLALVGDPGLGIVLRERALAWLSEAQPGAEAKVVPALIAELEQEDPQRKQEAIRLLTRLGPLAKAAGPALLRLWNDPEFVFRSSAGAALSSVDTDLMMRARFGAEAAALEAEP